MIRLGFYILLAVLLALGAVWLADHPGELLINWRGWEIRMPMAIFSLLALLYSLALWGLFRLYRWFRTDNPLASEKRRQSRRQKGRGKLDLGWSALAVEDKNAAVKYGRAALTLLPGNDGPLRLLARASDRKEQQKYINQLLNHPGSRLVALRHRFDQQSDDQNSRHDTLLEMQAICPDNTWVRGRLFNNLARLGQWDDARGALKKMALDKTVRRHLSATLNYCQALEADISGHKDTAIDLARRALKEDPALLPAALLLTRTLQGENQKRKAEKVIEAIWKIAPHPDLADLYRDLDPHISRDEQAVRMRRLKNHTPDAGQNARWLCGNCHQDLKKYSALCPACHEFGTVFWQDTETVL